MIVIAEIKSPGECDEYIVTLEKQYEQKKSYETYEALKKLYKRYIMS